jgi:hypothetical protein
LSGEPNSWNQTLVLFEYVVADPDAPGGHYRSIVSGAERSSQREPTVAAGGTACSCSGHWPRPAYEYCSASGRLVPVRLMKLPTATQRIAATQEIPVKPLFVL